MRQLYGNGRVLTLVVAGAFACLALLSNVQLARSSSSPWNLMNNLIKLPRKYEGKLLKTEFKIFLTKMNIRRVPLTQKHAERALSKLYKEELALREELKVIESNLMVVRNNKHRNGLRVLQVESHENANRDAIKGGNYDTQRPMHLLSEVTQPRIDKWREEMAEKQARLKELKQRIRDARNLINEPENYISVPSNYGRVSPSKQRELEREVLLKDREAMLWRHNIALRKIPSPWLTDEW